MNTSTLRISPDALWVALAAAFTGAVAGQWPVRNWDFWWHVVMGRLAATTGQHPDKLYFLYTMDPQAPSYVQAHLAQRTFWALQQLGGDSVIPVLLTRNLGLMAVALVSALVAWRRSGSGLVAATLVVMASSFTTTYVDARSHLLVWPLFVPALGLAYAARAGKISPWLIAALYPALTALWANLHGSFLIPSLIALAALAAAVSDRWLAPQRWRPNHLAAWVLTLPLCWIAPAAHPMGLRGNYDYLRLMMQSESLRSVSSEWYPTTPLFPDVIGTLFYLLVPLLAALAYRQHRRGQRLNLLDLFLLAGFALMSLKQCRDLMWFGFTLPIAASPLLSGLVTPKPTAKGRQRTAILAASAAALSLALVAQPWHAAYRTVMPALVQEKPVRDRDPHMGVLLRATPIEAAAQIKAHPLFHPHTTRVFCDHNYAGFLLYTLQDPARPTPMTFTDHRYEIITRAIWHEYYLISEAQPGWAERLDHYRVDFVIASAEQAPLQRALAAHPAWKLLSTHPDHQLYVRDFAHALP
jgi:hypothetical protein